MPGDASEPLAGLLVVSLEQAVAAPLCTARLADAGARVIKVERPDGDFARGYDHLVNGGSTHFNWLNRGKQSVRLDIKDGGDAALLRRIVARADVFVQNLAPGGAARAGFGSAALRAAHPRLVTCDISGYGEDGPMRDRKAYDLLVQCETGLAAITGSPEGPGRVGVSIADLACGLNAYGGVLEALLRRDRTGIGSGVAVSLFDGLADLMAVPLLHHDYGGAAPERVGIAHPNITPYGVFRTANGEDVVLAIQNEREWRSFAADVLGDPGFAADPRYDGNSARMAHRAEVDGRVAAGCAALTTEELIGRLEAAHIAFARVNDVAGLSRHPHLRRVVAKGPEGPVNLPAPPVRWSDRRSGTRPIPALGEHDAAIRAEFA
ncbi:CaiB/BaiF CoA transferase family protein [Flavisphingomonas formosensis]|uniref:CaiB/BaiF CoA transferase family protein n=1 Tax=Flavisphingomonas formosensis TaxID=861534 RepID=UPI0012FAB19A|nr:CaiB/BaiF CoA-transferase family protein [Sphingomonas formosensis]